MHTEQNHLNNGNSPERDERFDQLMDLARDGVDEAIDDLWTQYGFDFRSGRQSDSRGLDLGDRTDLVDGNGLEGGVA